jgi:hypothetical protein
MRRLFFLEYPHLLRRTAINSFDAPQSIRVIRAIRETLAIRLTQVVGALTFNDLCILSQDEALVAAPRAQLEPGANPVVDKNLIARLKSPDNRSPVARRSDNIHPSDYPVHRTLRRPIKWARLLSAVRAPRRGRLTARTRRTTIYAAAVF